MRTFYLFKIKKPYYILTKNNPYNLFKALESIYYSNDYEITYSINYFNQIKENFNKEYINNQIYETYKNNYSYTKCNNIHIISDYCKREKTKLEINKTYLLIKSTKQVPTFLKNIPYEENVFVCDFKSKDYFWLNEINKVLV